MKKIAQFVLVLFAVGSIGFWVFGKISNAALPATPSGSTASGEKSVERVVSPQTQPVIVVTYFTTNVRCESCRKIETLTRACVEETFAAEQAAGAVRFQILNLDEPENKHFALDYSMAFKTVVVSEERPGAVLRWQKLDDVWTLLHNPDAFKAYVAKPVQAYLKAGS